MNSSSHMPWQQRQLTDNDRQKALNFMASVCEATGNLASSAHVPGPSHARAEKTFHHPTEITSVGGLRLSSIHALEAYLTEWFGAPAQRNEAIEAGEAQGLHLAYGNGIVVNYLLHRANGISFTLPKSAASQLATHVSAAQSALSSPEPQTKSQSSVAR